MPLGPYVEFLRCLVDAAAEFRVYTRAMGEDARHGGAANDLDEDEALPLALEAQHQPRG